MRKLTKLIFVTSIHIHTYTQTYYSDLIGPFPYGGPTMNVGSRHFNRKVLKVE